MCVISWPSSGSRAAPRPCLQPSGWGSFLPSRERGSAAEGTIMKQDERILSPEVIKEPGWRGYASDSLLAISGVALVTGVIAAAHLYPRIPSISLTYLLVIITLASARGRYAAILAALLASFSFYFFIAPPLYT